MGREFHVRFCEGLGVKFPRATRLIITGTSQVLLDYGVQPLVEHFLSERGLRLSHEKTHITHIDDGFDFLGQNVRRYTNGKVLLKPAPKSVRTFLRGLREVIQNIGRSLSAGDLIQVLNLKIRGWTLYHRHVSSQRTFAYVDYRLHQALWRWARRRHRGHSARWVKHRYFHAVQGRQWVFHGQCWTRNGESYTVDLLKAADVRMAHHVLVQHDANPYDPSWEPYYEERLQTKMQATLAGRATLQALYNIQDGRCEACHELFTDPSDWQLHHREWRVYGGDDGPDNLELLCVNCHRQVHSQGRGNGSVASREGRLSKA